MANATGQAINYGDNNDTLNPLVNINGNTFVITEDNYSYLAQQEYNTLVSGGATDNGTLLSSISDHYAALAGASPNTAIALPSDLSSGGASVANSGAGVSSPLPTSNAATSYGILDGLSDWFSGQEVTGIDTSGNNVYSPSPDGGFLGTVNTELSSLGEKFDLSLKTLQVVAIAAGIFFIYQISKE